MKLFKQAKKNESQAAEAEPAAMPQTPDIDPGAEFRAEALVKRRRDMMIHVFYWALILFAVYLIGRYAISYLAPFMIGFAVSLILRPVILWLRKKLKIKHNIVAIAIVALFYSTIGVLLVLGLINLITWIRDVGLTWLADLYTKTIKPALDQLLISVDKGVGRMDSDVAEVVKGLIESVRDWSNSLVSTDTIRQVTNALTNFLGSLPGFLLNTVFTVVFTFFISLDYGNVTRFVTRQMPTRAATVVRDVKNTLGGIIWKFIRSYSIIMLVTFFELWLGLSILGVGDAFLLALLIAVFDILPVVGTGTVVIPWALISFFIGNTGLGIGLLVMYVVIFVVRNIIEPRIVGKGVGVHPLATLLALFVGAKLFGAIGLFGAPITLAIIKSLNDRKIIKLYK